MIEQHSNSILHNTAVLFDLDGTIIEPQEGIINSILYALQKMGIEEPHKEELRDFIGPPLIDSFALRYHLPREKANEAVQWYREYFSAQGLYQATLYDGMESLLSLLHTQGKRLFVATSKPTVFAEQILHNFRLHSLFEAVIGSNLDNTRKDKNEIIAFVLNEFCVERSTAVMVGDRKYDILGAKDNAIQSIGVAYGHGSVAELQHAHADHIVHTCQELQSLLVPQPLM